MLILRDVINALYLFIGQILNKMLKVRRSQKTTISITLRYDSHWRKREGFLILNKRSVIEDRVVINTFYGDVSLGEGSSIGINSILIGPITIGDNSMIAQNCFVSGENHNFQDITIPFKKQGFAVSPVNIGSNVWLGANCVVLPGVTIGSNVVIGGGSVVTKNIPDNVMAVGNPAKVFKKYSDAAGAWETNA